jgi:photosystem II stability/assembly factor-like uncharacterized protein
MIIATKKAVYLLKKDGSENKPSLLLDSIDVRRVVEGEERNVVATAENILIILDAKEKQLLETGIKDRIDSLCIVKEKPLDLLIGTTPPYIYRIDEEGPAQWIKTFDDLEVRSQWYTPWGGPAAVRSMTSTKKGWVYADIHVGSIMRSPDNGRTWEPVTPTLHKDVHEVSTTPASERRVYANTYLSFYISDTKGDSWEHRSKNLNNRYGRGIAVNPRDPDTILCGVSDGPTGVDVNGQLYYTEDAGATWTHVTKGFPESTKKNIDTFHIAYADNDVAWVTDENTLFMSRDGGKTWETYWKAPEEILMISCRS